MRNCYVLLFSFFSMAAIAQNDSIKYLGAVAADRMNVVYRGISNPISIAVSDCKSFTASGPGLKHENGRYFIIPGPGIQTNIVLKIIKNDGTEITENHLFKIKNIPPFMGTINGLNCASCLVELPKSELKEAIVSVESIFDLSYKIEDFTVAFSDKKSILNKGNHFNKETNHLIQNSKIGSEITICYIRLENQLNSCLRHIIPIKIKIVEEEIPYFQSKAFIKDSLNQLKERKLKRKKV